MIGRPCAARGGGACSVVTSRHSPCCYDVGVRHKCQRRSGEGGSRLCNADLRGTGGHSRCLLIWSERHDVIMPVNPISKLQSFFSVIVILLSMMFGDDANSRLAEMGPSLRLKSARGRHFYLRSCHTVACAAWQGPGIAQASLQSRER